MRYLLMIAAIAVAACTVPPYAQKVETPPLTESPVMEIRATREEPKPDPKPEPKPMPPKSKDKHVPICTGINTGDAEESVHLKLDCLLLETK